MHNKGFHSYRMRISIIRYFSRGGEIRHDNRGLSWAPLPAFHAGIVVLEGDIFSGFGLIGLGLLKISFMDW